MATSWFNDAGAYFVGRAMGKHKLAPEISPKKTVEGAIGGVVCSIIFCAVYAWAFVYLARVYYEIDMTINWLGLVLFVPVGALAGILGDLSASIVKRQCSVKDFGNIMPGHGGVLDRFDSFLFVAPLLYTFVRMFPIIFLN